MAYHHGDLQDTLLREAATLLRESGLGGLSLRKLAERAGVSRTAPYHHFKSKNELLNALAMAGFETLLTMTQRARFDQHGLVDFVTEYMHFACDNPEQYDLMFGRTIWKNGEPSAALRTLAYGTFREYARRVTALFRQTGTSELNALRLAQASWGTLHGLCRLHIDGIYVGKTEMLAAGEQAARLFLQRLNSPAVQ